MSAKVIAFCNQKGGVAKTTTVINTGAALAKAGKRVLLIDADPQSSLSVSLGLDVYDDDVTTYEIMLKKADAADAIRENVGSGYDVIATDLRLCQAEIELAGKMTGRLTALKKGIKHFISEYDFILIDCPPSLGLITYNALVAATDVVTPVQAQYLAISGLTMLLDTLEDVKEENSKLNYLGALITLYNGRTKHAKESRQQLTDFLDGKLFETVIRENIALADAGSYAQDIYQYDARSNGAEDYKSFAAELIKKEA